MSETKVMSNEDIVFWQEEGPSGENIAEPAVLLKHYSEHVELVQGGNEILLNHTKANMKQFAKMFNELAKTAPE